jgi:hypothetical protein
MTRNKQTIEVVTVSEGRRRRWSTPKKAALVRETYGLCRVVDQTARFPRKQHGPAQTGRTIPASAENWSAIDME